MDDPRWQEKEAAAYKVLKDCLRVDGLDRVVVLLDDFGYPLASMFSTVLEALNPRASTSVYVPLAAQRRGVQRPLAHIIEDSSVLITALGSLMETTKFRADVLSLAVEADARIVHIVGLDEDYFSKLVLATDFGTIEERSGELRDMLTKARSLEVLTRDSSGTLHALRISIEGREPRISGGRAVPGRILSLPSGETYVAPVDGTGGGKLVLNGSSLDVVFNDSPSPLLAFRAGRLVLSECHFPDEGPSRRLLKNLRRLESAEPGAFQLAEVGFGTNNAVTQLTGESAIDEKAGGTAHIAIGSNIAFGGTMSANFHIDMVFFPEAVLVDGRPLHHGWATPGQRRHLRSAHEAAGKAQV